MHENLILQLKKLKAIEPNADFKTKSRRLLFAHTAIPETATKSAVFAIPWRWNFAPIFGALLIIVIGTIVLLSPSKTPAVASLNTENLTQELKDLTINIQLQDVSYTQNVNQTIASALTEISDIKTKHLSPSLLQSEEQGLDGTDSTDTQSAIDTLLNSVIK